MPSGNPQHRNWSCSNSGEVGSRQSPVSTSEGRRSPNGRRSYQERITTVRFIQPSTGEMMCTKLNRVQRTKTKPDNDAELCESFLKGHCDSGNACQYVHVPKQYLWRLLSPHVDPKTLFYYPGFNVRCYTPDMNVYYDIPSEFIYQTRGSDRYVELFNDNGDNFKDKCRLCPDLQSNGVCDSNEQCDDIHCAVADLEQFPHIATHRATKEAVDRYEHMPAELIVRVYQPNTPGDGVDFNGDDVLRTAGATQYEEAYKQTNGIPALKMQHCAHFQTKKLCRMGDGCRFLHVVSVALASPAPEEEASVRSSPVPATTTASAASAPSATTPTLTAAKTPAATMTAATITSGRQLREEDVVMNAAAEMAAIAMTTEELRYVDSHAGNTAPQDSRNNQSQKYGPQAAMLQKMQPNQQPQPYEQPQPYQRPQPYEQPQPYGQPQPHRQPQPHQHPQQYQQPQPYEQPQPHQQPQPYEHPQQYQHSQQYEQPQSHQQPQPHQQPQSFQSSPQPNPVYPYGSVSMGAVNERVSPVQYRSSGRLSPIKVVVTPGQMEGAPAQRLSSMSLPSGGSSGTPTQQPQSRTSPLRRNNPYSLSPSSTSLN